MSAGASVRALQFRGMPARVRQLLPGTAICRPFAVLAVETLSLAATVLMALHWFPAESAVAAAARAETRPLGPSAAR